MNDFEAKVLALLSSLATEDIEEAAKAVSSMSQPLLETAKKEPKGGHRRFLNLRPGDVFERWTVVAFAGFGSAGRQYFCRCDCGRLKVIAGTRLRQGEALSCGCLRKERAAAAASKSNSRHGMSGTPEYHIWFNMIDRCHNPKTNCFANYGGRGISVCDRWRNSLHAFVEDAGRRPSRLHSLDRINNDGNYEPGNVRWATAITQQNNKRSNRIISFNGVTKTLTEWARSTGIGVQTLEARILHLGWPIERALTAPKRGRGSNQYNTAWSEGVRLKCSQCKHEWVSKSGSPKRCPNHQCSSNYWRGYR